MESTIFTLALKPEHLIECKEGMSNFDHSIDDGLEEKLRSGEFYCQHSAWNFCGHVWFDPERDLFLEEVWINNCRENVMSAKTLEDLMEAVNDYYGRS